MKFYGLAARCCEGSEGERYTKIYFDLDAGLRNVTDEYWK